MKNKILDATNPQAWLDSKAVSADMKKQINAMTKKEQKIAFDKKPLAFGTAGIRGKMGPGTHYLNKFVYQQMTIGYCHYILNKKTKHKRILICHDNRLNSAEFALECARVALGMGVTPYLMEENKLLPTPIASYAIRKFKLSGGINITASHNPKEDNGFKAYNKLGAQILPDEANIIVKNMPSSKTILDLKRYLKSNSRSKNNITEENNCNMTTGECNCKIGFWNNTCNKMCPSKCLNKNCEFMEVSCIEEDEDENGNGNNGDNGEINGKNNQVKDSLKYLLAKIYYMSLDDNEKEKFQKMMEENEEIQK